MKSRIVAAESITDQVKTSVSNQLLDFDSLSLSVTDLSDAFDLLERKVQQAETNPPTADTTGTVSDDQFGSAKVQQMIDKSNAAIRSEFDQANFEQSEKISQLDRKFSERYDFD